MKRSLFLFIGLCALLICQLVWWIYSFYHLNMTSTHFQLLVSPSEKNNILRETFHRNVMFFSESLFFMTLTSLGVFWLYRAYQREKASKERQKDFLQLLSHESKTPLTTIKLQLEKLKSELQKNNRIEVSLSEVRRLNQLYEKVISLFRAEEKSFVPETFNLRDLIRLSLENLKNFFDEHQVEVHFLEACEEPLVFGDFFSLQVAIKNILENAVLHNASSIKKLWVEVKRSETQIQLSIWDNGEGVSAEERQLIFNKFYRGTKSEKVQGSGLGLYISKKIVEAHAGLIELKYPNVFNIQIPEARN